MRQSEIYLGLTATARKPKTLPALALQTLLIMAPLLAHRQAVSLLNGDEESTRTPAYGQRLGLLMPPFSHINICPTVSLT